MFDINFIHTLNPLFVYLMYTANWTYCIMHLGGFCIN